MYIVNSKKVTHKNIYFLVTLFLRTNFCISTASKCIQCSDSVVLATRIHCLSYWATSWVFVMQLFKISFQMISKTFFVIHPLLVCLSVCLSLCLAVCLSVCLSNLSPLISIYLSIYLPVCLSVYLSSDCQSGHLSVSSFKPSAPFYSITSSLLSLPIPVHLTKALNQAELIELPVPAVAPCHQSQCFAAPP